MPSSDHEGPFAVDRDNPARELRYVREGGPKLVFRPLMISDAARVKRAVASSLPELQPFMPWAHLPNTLAGQVARLKQVEHDNLTGREIQFGVHEEGDDELRMLMGLHARVPLNPRGMEIGYWTVSQFAKRGLCTLGVQVLTVYAIDLLGCDRVQILTDDGNRASQRVAEKANYALEARMRNITVRPEEELVAKGFRGSPVTLVWAMVPELLAHQPWAREVRSRLEVDDILGRRLPGWPRAR